ncbi:MAG: PP2C family serine/threonine-protein phosphatase [Campylobacter concisus]
MYKICGIALRGRGHIKHNMPCQDKIAYFQSGNLNIIALSDGAGSAKYSHFGAEKSVKFVCEEFSKNFDGYFNQQDGNVVKSAILSKVRSRMIDLSNEHDCEISDLAHTLLFVAIKDNNFILFHIGDGIIGCVKNRQIKVASLPTNGEFANVTVFATSDDALQNAKIIKGKIDQIEGFVLMSDGSSESFYDKQSKNLTKILLKLINLNAILPSGILQDKLEISFEKSVLVKTSDDCSLVMISKAMAFSSLSIWEQGEILGIKDHKKLQKNISLLQFLQSKKSVGEIIKFMHLKKRLVKRRLDDLSNLSLIKRTDAFYEALVS